MSITEEIETEIEEVLEASTVEKASAVVRSRSGITILGIVSFLESALPIPILTDPFLIAAILLDRVHVKRYIIVTTVTSALGGVAAYYMAYYFIDILLGLMPLSMVEEFQTIVSGTEISTMMLTLVGAVTPVPYTASAWAVAVLQGSIAVFIVGSLLGRGFRYAIVGYCAYKFGPLAISYAKKYIGIASVVVLILIILYILLKL
jgi:membrane protein YqaA with SNARE-associated domain